MAAMTGLLVELVHEFQVSTWPINTFSNDVPFNAVFTCVMYSTRVAGPAPTPVGSFSMPVTETRYRSSLPTESPTTRSVKSVP